MTFLIYYVTAAMAVAVLTGRANWLPQYRLANAGVSTRALVTKTACWDHSKVFYRFTADGQSVDGQGDAGHGNPPCTTLNPGDPIQVVYLANAPQTNLPGDPKERLGNETAAIALAALFLPLVLIFVLFLFLRKRQHE
jgi:hypothetical protein